jgi:hypothetical protein
MTGRGGWVKNVDPRIVAWLTLPPESTTQWTVTRLK